MHNAWQNANVRDEGGCALKRSDNAIARLEYRNQYISNAHVGIIHLHEPMWPRRCMKGVENDDHACYVLRKQSKQTRQSPTALFRGSGAGEAS